MAGKGSGKRWSVEERVHLTEAWVDASEDAGEVEVKGTYQDSDVFWQRVYDKFIAKASPRAAKGSYKDRQVSAITNQWKDKIAREVKKFNKSLVKVYSSKPTGCTEQNQVNMAVAIHIGKTSTMSYIHKEFEANDWDLYQCWLVLKTHKAFLPPSVPTEENTVDMDDALDDASDGQDGSDGQERSVSDITVNTNTAVKPSKKSSRGPGAGAKKTKALAAENDYKKKKTKIQEGFLEVQRQRQTSFESYVKNHARTKAFEMAVMGYKTFKDSDPEEAAKYKFHMNNIIQGNTDGDNDEEEMPALPGRTGV